MFLPRLIRMKLLKTKDKKIKLWKRQERNYTILWGKKCSDDSGFLSRIQKEVAYHFSGDDSRHTHPRILYLAKVPFRNEGEIKTFSDKGKENKLSPAEGLKEILKTQRKWWKKESWNIRNEERTTERGKIWVNGLFVSWVF